VETAFFGLIYAYHIGWTKAHDEPSGPLSPLTSETPVTGRDRSHVFKDIIMKCVIQLLLIETTNDLLQNKEVYTTIPPDQLLKLMSVLDHSYQFARSFNADKELRTGLWKVGMYSVVAR
jgi:brefeldin A-inhibited guanine nucleotide-exchange protein